MCSHYQSVIMFTSTLSIQEFVKGCGSVTKHWVDDLLDKMTAGDHVKAATQIRQVSGFYTIHAITSMVHSVSFLLARAAFKCLTFEMSVSSVKDTPSCRSFF